jgi:hypothetical protein
MLHFALRPFLAFYNILRYAIIKHMHQLLTALNVNTLSVRPLERLVSEVTKPQGPPPRMVEIVKVALWNHRLQVLPLLHASVGNLDHVAVRVAIARLRIACSAE